MNPNADPFIGTGNAINPEVDAIVTNAPFAETEEERQRKEAVKNLMQYRVSVLDEYPPEVCLLTACGVPFFAKGDIHAIKAKQKQGKTNAISLMMAAILGGKWGKLEACMEGAKVLFIDTEQKGADVQIIYNRTLELAGLPKEDIFDRFQMFRLRPLDTEGKLNAAKALIAEYRPDIVFIDGIVDLMGNFNEVDDSKLIIEELLRMSTKEVSGIDTAIVCVLHTNKATDDHNMRGHAGTMLSQKAGNVLEVEKKNGVMTVRNSDSRHEEVPEWSFMFDKDGNIVDADEVRSAMLEEQKKLREEAAAMRYEDKREERKKLIEKIINENGGPMPRNLLRNSFMQKTRLSKPTTDSIIAKGLKDGWIVKNSSNYIVTKNDA